MKKLFKGAFFLLLALLFSSASSFAYTKTSASPTTTMEKPVMKTEKNDYQLAYPGMLPDNPLYKIKVLRDKIMEKLIIDPQKKIDYYLLQTDKQIAMVAMLVDKKASALAKETALKGENNFTELVFMYKKTSTKPDAKTLKKLQKAAGKHQEILMNSIKKVNAEDAKVLQQVINFSKTNVTELEKLFKGIQ